MSLHASFLAMTPTVELLLAVVPPSLAEIPGATQVDMGTSRLEP